MPTAWFDELAAGGGSAEAVGFLFEGERARRLLLFRQLLDQLREEGDMPGGPKGVEHAWQLFSAAARRQPAAAEHLLMSPQVGSWIGHALRRLHRTSSGPPPWVDFGHLHAIALAACVRAGVDCDVEVPVREGLISLPTLGMAKVGGSVAGRFTTVDARLRGAVLHLTHSDAHADVSVDVRPLGRTDSPHWEALRVLSAVSGAAGQPWVWLDDLDPYRDLDEPIPPRRLDRAGAERWQRVFADAVRLLVVPTVQPGGLHLEHVKCIVPWAAQHSADARPGRGFSASTGDAFGSMIVALPPDAAAFAETMVHEFQHGKLGALLHLFPLLEDSGREEFYAPWRSDPRHVTGLLHGSYAFTGVAGFWRAQYACTGAESAAFHFAYRRLQARLVTHTLLTQGRLTPIGLRLVRGLTRTLDGWLREPLPSSARAQARRAVRRHRTEWRMRNLRCPAEEQSALVQGFSRSRSPVPGSRFAPVPAVYPARASRNCAEPDVPDTFLEPAALADWLLSAVAARPTYRRLLHRPERFAALLEATSSTSTPADLHRQATWLSTS